MKPFIILLAVFTITLIILRVRRHKYDWPLAGRIAMSVMLLFTAIGHFAFTEGMAMMIPSSLPFRVELVYFTGIIEIAAAIGLLLPSLRKITGWLLILFLVLVLPANIYAALHHVNYQAATLDGNGPDYLWFRVPLQIFFIGWVYLCAIRN